MTKNNVRIAIRDSTDSHNVAFFDNQAGIKYKSANLQRFLAGSASILTLKYNSKDIDSIRSGCKLAFRYKARDYWLNVMSFEKKGYEVELTAYSLGLELNNETRGEHKPADAMSIAEYVSYYDFEHALTIGVNEVSDKRIKLEWTGTDTILARLFSVANSFDAELDFSVELNDDYSLKRQVLNIYKKGNLGTNKVSQPVRVGKELKVINYSDNIKELRTAVRATGKDGLTIDGLNKKIYDDNNQLLYYSNGDTVCAPQSRDRFPSVGKGSNDNWIIEDLGETQYETKEALWAYLYSEIQKKSLPEITYDVEGAIDAGIGDTQILIDDIHFEPTLYVQARVSELEDDMLTGKVTKSTFINFERKYSQIADSLLKQVEALAEDAAPYIVRLSTDNGYIFKNGQGSSTITAKLEKYSKIVDADWKWLINNSVVSKTSSVTINASQVTGTLNVVAVASVDGNEVAREYITFTNSDDGVGIKSIERYYTTNNQAEGVTTGGQNWSTKPTTVTADKNYMWSYDVITYTNDTSLVTEPAVIGARGNDGLDADTTGITEALDKAKKELTTLSANVDKVRDDSLAAVNEAKKQLATVASDLNTAKQDLQNAVGAVDTKATNLQSDVSNLNTSLSNTAKALQTQGATLANQAKELQTQASQLTAQANAQSELTKRVSTVEETANGTKTTVSELSKTVAQNGKDITSATARTKTVETSLTSAKTSISELQTSVSTAQTDLTNLTKRTKTVEDGLSGTKTSLSELTQTVSSDGKTIASLTSRTKTVEDGVSGLKTTMSSVQKDLTAVTTRTKSVEDDLAGTKTTLSQVQTTANSASQKTATLETGLNGLSARFSSLKIGGRNLLAKTNQGKTNWSWSMATGGGDVTIESVDIDGVSAVKMTKGNGTTSGGWNMIKYSGLLRNLIESNTQYTLSFDVKPNVNAYFTATLMQPDARNRLTNSVGMGMALADVWTRISCVLTSVATLPESVVSQIVYLQGMPTANGNTVMFKNIKLEKGNIATDYSPNEADLEQKVAEYRQTAEQNYASLQSTVQALDGTVTANKTTAKQTAAGFKTRIESLETYKDGETTRASQYFESAKTETARQLTAERTAIAKDYVAKSTYTSDVTGIRNDLTATTTTANTTKTNLANYQASNDKAVANLQSNLQTANGSISSLQTKVEAVPGQITSAVSAVEGKIPTEIGSSNLLRNTAINADNLKLFGASNSTISIVTKDGHQTYKIVASTANNSGVLFNGNVQYYNLIKDRYYTFSFWVLTNKDKSYNFNSLGHIQAINNNSDQVGNDSTHQHTSPVYSASVVKANTWTKVWCTFKATSNSYFKPYFWYLTAGDEIYIYDMMLNEGKVPLSYTPAVEDTQSDINAVSSELKQTKDGMTLLATKTELNTAKSDLQSDITTATNKANTAQSTADNNAKTISTHTTQISALNTGLSAKVSQTDFNTLSGRVTTAENNITAKANELSSKISSVEGKIPTNVSTRNLVLKSNDFTNPHKQNGDKTTVTSTDDYFVIKSTGYTANAFGGMSWNMSISEVKAGEEFSVLMPVYVDSSIELDGDVYFQLKNYPKNIAAYSYLIPKTQKDKWFNVAITFKATKDVAFSTYPFYVYLVKNGLVRIKPPMLVRGSLIPSDYQPAPEDYDSKLASAQSEIKQTTDAISASVSALDNATVKTATLNLDNNGFVTKVGKTVNGNTLATMIAQNESDVQIIAKKMKVSGDMIVNGAITAEKLNINSLSALSADLGDVASGSITNTFSSGKRSGSIKIKDDVEITSTDTSNLLPEKAKENLVLSTGSLTMNASTSSDEATHSMLIMPETIKYTKNNYDTTRGGTSGWSLTHNGYYSILKVDMVWQNVRLNNTSNLMFGVSANYVRIGNLVTISVNRQIKNITMVTEDKLADERIPEGFRPISQAHLILVGNVTSSIDATCVVHLNPDGTIRFTNNTSGNHVWSGTVTYTCVEPMPYVKDLNNGSTI